MAKERLSKLQRWILMETYKLNVLHDGSVVGRESNMYYVLGSKHLTGYSKWAFQYFECWIYEKYYGFSNKYGSGISKSSAYKTARVTVCRSVRNLELKGLIEINRYYDYKMKNWSITEKGIVALKLPVES
jgi:hypothetical protein